MRFTRGCVIIIMLCVRVKKPIIEGKWQYKREMYIYWVIWSLTELYKSCKITIYKSSACSLKGGEAILYSCRKTWLRKSCCYVSWPFSLQVLGIWFSSWIEIRHVAIALECLKSGASAWTEVKALSQQHWLLERLVSASHPCSSCCWHLINGQRGQLVKHTICYVRKNIQTVLYFRTY